MVPKCIFFFSQQKKKMISKDVLVNFFAFLFFSSKAFTIVNPIYTERMRFFSTKGKQQFLKTSELKEKMASLEHTGEFRANFFSAK